MVPELGFWAPVSLVTGGQNWPELAPWIARGSHARTAKGVSA